MRRLGWMSIVFGVGVAVAAVLGPLVLGVIEYHVVDDVLNQVKGGDAIGLAAVAPVAIVAGVLMLRGHRAGPVLAMAPAAYGVYTYVQLSLGGEFVAEPGNSERFFPLFLGLVVLGGAIFASAWLRTDPATLPTMSRRLRSVIVWVLGLLAAFLAVGLHLPGLVDVIGGAPYEVEYTQSPTVFWIVKLMDLGIVVPMAIVAAYGLRRHMEWGTKVGYVVLGWGALLGSAVAGMAVVMQVNDDPAASVGLMVGFGLFALGFLALAIAVYRPLFAFGTSRSGDV